jgi:hypothetical protein
VYVLKVIFVRIAIKVHVSVTHQSVQNAMNLHVNVSLLKNHHALLVATLHVDATPQRE